MRFPKPRYSLATLFCVMTAVAIVLWGVPECRDYLRRAEFERAAGKLKVGPAPASLVDVLPSHSNDGSYYSTTYFDADGYRVEISPFYYKRSWYYIYRQIEPIDASTTAGARGRGGRRGQSNDRWVSVRVYRLPPVSPDYRGQSKTTQNQDRRRNTSQSKLARLQTTILQRLCRCLYRPRMVGLGPQVRTNPRRSAADGRMRHQS